MSRSSKSSADASSSRRWYSRYTSAMRRSGGVNARVDGLLRGDQLVLQRRDRGVQAAGREPLRVEVEVAPHVVDEAHGVGLVVDRERRPVAHAPARRGAGCARTPSGTSTPTSCRATGPTSAGDALLHLARGLVGERDREEPERRHPPLGDQVRDAVREHPGLARSGARDDEDRPVGRADRLVLHRVEAGEQRLGRAAESRVWCRSPTAPWSRRDRTRVRHARRCGFSRSTRRAAARARRSARGPRATRAAASCARGSARP